MPFLLLEVRCKESKECQSTEVFTVTKIVEIEELAMTQHYLDGINVKLLDTLTISFLVPEREMCLPFFWCRRLIWKKTNFPGTSRVQNIQSSGLECTHCCVKVFARKRIFDIISKDTLPWLDVFGNKEVSNSCTRVSWHPSSASLVRYVPQNCFENGWLESSFFSDKSISSDW